MLSYDIFYFAVTHILCRFNNIKQVDQSRLTPDTKQAEVVGLLGECELFCDVHRTRFAERLKDATQGSAVDICHHIHDGSRYAVNASKRLVEKATKQESGKTRLSSFDFTTGLLWQTTVARQGNHAIIHCDVT